MFGYVTVSKEQLTEEEYDTFCSYYCGVCKATGRYASQLSRLGLSYDITFLAAVLSSLADDELHICSEHCIIHPVKKRGCVKESEAVSYAARMGVILQYLKLKDDFNDDRSLKALMGMLLMRRGCKRAAAAFENISDAVNEQLKKLSALEKRGCSSIDEAADAFAKILERLFTPDFIKDNNQKRILAWLGYNLGRWIYILDAYNDMDSDFKSGAYNPFLADGGKPEDIKISGRQEIELGLTFTLENIASAFELLSFKRNESLIGKIIYTSLKQKQAFILNGGKNEGAEGLLKRRNK